MNTNKNEVVALLSGAITASLSGDEITATKNTAHALLLLASGAAKTVATTTKKTVTVVKKSKGAKSSVKRGPKPLLSQTQVASMVQRVASGETVVNVAKAFNISYPTAHRYIKSARQTSTEAQVVNN